MARTPITTKRELYSDFFTDFMENPVSEDLARVTNEEAVKQSLKYLLLTDKGERPFRPNLGADIRRMLFENITPATIITARESIRETISAYEPRINVMDIDIRASADENRVTISIVFTVINSEREILFTTTLSRVR